MTPKVITLDFETKKITPRPQYPPKPVSIGIKWPDSNQYKLLAWGHPTGNTCDQKEARAELKKAYDSKYGLLCQNGTFDHDVAETHWELPMPPWERRHDTKFLIFLDDPYAESLSLKPSAERLLGVKPEEQDKMRDWILANVPEAARKPSEWGGYISECPFKIVGPYLKGDLTRTFGIFELLYRRIVEAGMLEAYHRELRLMPMLLRNERKGMRVDVPGMERDLPAMLESIKKADMWLEKKLKRPGLNPGSSKQLSEALLSSGAVTGLDRSDKGKWSVGKKSMTLDKFKDKQLYQVLTYRSQMSTSANTFMGPWLELAGKGDVIHPNWWQVKASKGESKDNGGAKSGRLICSKPNLLNIPKKWKKAISAGYVHPAFLGGVELPFMRTYALPRKGKRWGRRDYNQQELRVFGHFEEGPVMEGFLTDPKYDIHELARAAQEIALVESGLRTEFGRDDAKTSVFGDLYGQGVQGLMDSLKLREEDKPVAQLIKKALKSAIPTIEALSKELKALVNSGLPIRTWGSRLYYKEPNRYVAKFGRDMDFAYKMLNYLIQGSAADCTKEALIRYDADPRRGEDLIVTVYDEVNIDLPMSAKGAKHEMTVLRDVMQSVEFDIPMLSDGEIGPSWGKLEKYSI